MEDIEEEQVEAEHLGISRWPTLSVVKSVCGPNLSSTPL
jgi:hypothetical protein